MPIFGASLGEGEKTGEKDSVGTYCSYVNFKNGSIECFANGPEDNVGNAYAIFDPLRSKWASMGYAKSFLGYPIDNMSNEETSKFGTKFRYQNFANGTEKGALEYNITSGDVFEVHGPIFKKWGDLGYAQSDLGLPIKDQENRSGYWYCDFEGGNISWDASANAYVVKLNNIDSTIKVGQGATTPEITQKFVEACDRNGGLSVLGNPTTKVHYAFRYEVQDFPEMPATAGGVIMYNPNNSTAYFIHGAIWDRYYVYPDANKTRLGAIASDEKDASASPKGTVGRYTEFENGSIHWISNKEGENVGHLQRGKSFVTYSYLNKMYDEMGGTGSELGFPIEDQRTNADGHDYCKFEGGEIQWDSTNEVYYSTTTQNQPLSITLKSPVNNQKFTVNDLVSFTGEITGGNSPYTVKLFINDIEYFEPLDKISEQEYTISRSMSAEYKINEYKIRMEATDSKGAFVKTDEITITVSPVTYEVSFFPSISGYSFQNFDTPEVSWNEFESIYGHQDMYENDPYLNDPIFPPVPTKAYIFYNKSVKTVGKRGNCFGFSGSSLQLNNNSLIAYDPNSKKEDKVPDAWRKVGPYAYGYSPVTIQDWIEYYTFLMHDNASEADQSKYNGAENVSNELKLRMSSNDWTEGSMILGYQFDMYNASSKKMETGGHAVVPYMIVEDKNTVRIYIYDCNHPADSERFIELDKFTWEASVYEDYNNDGIKEKPIDLCAISLKSLNEVPVIPDDVVYNDVNFANLLFTDSSGKQLGYYQGEFKDEITSAHRMTNYGSSAGSESLESYYVPDSSMKMELYGKNEGTSNISMLTPNGAITASVPVSSNSVDEFKMLNDGKGVEFKSGSGTQSLNLTVSVETSDSAQIVYADFSQISTGRSIDLSNIDGTINIENDGQPITCSLHLAQLGINTSSNDSIENIVIEGESTIIVKPTDWTDLANSEVTIEHDIGSDGIIDSTEIIRPIKAEVTFDPETFSLNSTGDWVTAYIELPAGYSVSDIDINSVLLNGTVHAVSDPKYDFVTNESEYMKDLDLDGIPERMFKFNRGEVAGILKAGDQVTVTFTGKVEYNNGISSGMASFEGSDVIKVTESKNKKG